MGRRRVVVTGIGVVTPIGIGREAFWNSLVQGRNAVDRITAYTPESCPCHIAAEARDFDPLAFMSRKDARLLARCQQMGLAATSLCLNDADWHTRPGDGRCGVATGMSTSAQDAVEQLIGVFNTHGFRRILPHYLNQVSPHTGAVEMGLLTGFQDQVMTFATACTCGVNAFRYAFEELRNGRCEAFLVSAMDASITPSGVASFCRAHMVTTAWNHDPKHASRPFDLKRDGGVLGEGAVTVLLETEEHARRRGARVCAEVLGCATAGRGCGGQENERVPQAMAQTMTAALADAGVGSEAVGYIGANGVSDPGLDAWETVAVKAVFGEQARRIPISSIKSMIGIAPGPAGVLQTVSTALAIRYEMLPPTINYEYADPVCDLDYVPNRARRNRVQTALVLTHGLGGGDVAIVLGRHRDSAIGGP